MTDSGPTTEDRRRFYRLFTGCLLWILLTGCAQDSLYYTQAFSDKDTHASGSASTSDTDDLWEAFRTGMALPQIDNPRIAQARAFYLRYPRHLPRVQQQAKPYIKYILTELERRHLPSELALIPMVESGYRPNARSPYAAVGLWQFMPATGRAYGLHENEWYDGRRDVIASTQAALSHLSRVHAEFNNDWLLTLAAYNAGGPTIRNAIKRNLEQGKPTDYWSLDLPRETQRYVPRLLALKQLFETPEHYGIHLLPISNQPHFESVEVGSPIDFVLAARLAGMDKATFRQLNPGFKLWFTGPGNRFRLQVPYQKGEEFRSLVAAIPPQNRVLLKPHQVTKGETLLQIASLYNSQVELIKHQNGLETDKLKVSSTLWVPTPYSEQAASKPETAALTASAGAKPSS